MSLDRNKKVLFGIFGGALGRSITLLAPFIVMPIILKELDVYLFGIWMTIMSITSMALFLDFGIGNGLLTKLSYQNGLNNYKKMKEYIVSAYVALTAISVFLLIIILASYFYVSLSIELPLSHNKLALDIMLITAIVFVLGIPVSVIQRVMYAKHQIFLYNIWQILGSILAVSLCYIAVQFKFSPAIIIFSYSFPPIAVMFLSTFIFFNKNKDIKPRFDDFSKEKCFDLLGIGSKFLILSILTSIALNADNFIISYKVGAEYVTHYAVPAKIASLLGVIITTLFLPLWAANGDALANKDYNWVIHTTKKMMAYGFICVSLLSMILIKFNYEIIDLWMGRSFYNQKLTLIFLCVLSVLMAIGSPWFMILNSLGNIKIQIKVWFVFLIFTIVAKLFFLDSSRLWIMALITSVSYMVIILPVLLYISNKSINDLKKSI